MIYISIVLYLVPVYSNVYESRLEQKTCWVKHMIMEFAAKGVFAVLHSVVSVLSKNPSQPEPLRLYNIGAAPRRL